MGAGRRKRRLDEWQQHDDAGVAAFQDLCAGLCDLLKVQAPTLEPDDEGRVTFHVVMRDSIVNLVHCPAAGRGHFFALFELGPVGRHGGASHGELQVLLEANFVLQVHPTVFSRNPATGDAVMQRAYPLHETTPSASYELIDQGIAAAARWRDAIRNAGSSSTHGHEQVQPLAMLNLA